jgi:hypothetical protein
MEGHFFVLFSNYKFSVKFLVIKHPIRKSARLSPEVMWFLLVLCPKKNATPIHFITKCHSLFPSSFTCTVIVGDYSRPTPKRERYRLTKFPYKYHPLQRLMWVL